MNYVFSIELLYDINTITADVFIYNYEPIFIDTSMKCIIDIDTIYIYDIFDAMNIMLYFTILYYIVLSCLFLSGLVFSCRQNTKGDTGTNMTMFLHKGQWRAATSFPSVYVRPVRPCPSRWSKSVQSVRVERPFINTSTSYLA